MSDMALLLLMGAAYSGWIGFVIGLKLERKQWAAHIQFAQGYIEAGRLMKQHRLFCGPDVEITRTFDINIRDVGDFKITMREAGSIANTARKAKA